MKQLEDNQGYDKPLEGVYYTKVRRELSRNTVRDKCGKKKSTPQHETTQTPQVTCNKGVSYRSKRQADIKEE